MTCNLTTSPITWLLRTTSLALMMLVVVSRTSAQDVDPSERAWNEDIIYFAMTDRFCDGDSANNMPLGSDPNLYDPTQTEISLYHGGDFRGIELAIQDGYFNDLGVTAIWLTPPVRGAWRSVYDLGGPKTGYHGYWAQDFLDIDPHWVSSISLDGEAYDDTRDGRMQHYKDLVDLAHRHGIKVIQDVVCNHIGPLFFYDMNGNGELDLETKDEWIAPYSETPYTNTSWVHIPKWNLVRPQPDGPEKVLGKMVATRGIFQNFEIYGRRGFNDDSLGKSDGEEVRCDFFSLRDMLTHPDSAHFDSLVDEFVEIYYYYIDTIGIDGLRLDTVKHVDHEFWTEFTRRLRARLGDDAAKLLITGEVYDGNPKVLGRYTYSLPRSTGELTSDTCLDSLLNFQFCFNLRDYLRKPNDSFGNPWGLQNTTECLNQEGAEAFYNATAGFDGLRPRQKMVNFFENHDGLNRFLVNEVEEVKHRLALTILLTSEGIPCVYYGGEVSLRDDNGRLNHDSETGRLMFARSTSPTTLLDARDSEAFRLIKRLSEIRQTHRALTEGNMATLWVDSDTSSNDDGLYVYARYVEDEQDKAGGSKAVLIAINANPNDAAKLDELPLTVGLNGRVELADSGSRFTAEAVVGANASKSVEAFETDSGKPAIALEVPPSSAIIYTLNHSLN